jgi:hypothetical protein
MRTELTIESDARRNGVSVRLFIANEDRGRAEFTDFDKAVIADTLEADERTIADRLLGLETVVRRIEECNSTSTPPTAPISFEFPGARKS